MGITNVRTGTRAIPLSPISRQIHTVNGPFAPRTTLIKPSHFPSPYDRFRTGEYLFMTRIAGYQIGGSARYREGKNRVLVTLYAPRQQSSPGNLGQVQQEVARRLGLHDDLSGYERIWAGDPILRSLPSEMMGARPSSPFALYEFLVICTLLQNTVVRRTVQMANALAEYLGGLFQFPDGTTLRGFWEPGALVSVGESRLRELRLGYRAKTLVRFSEQFSNQPTLEADLLGLAGHPDSLRDAIDDIYGVGPASANYVLFEWFKCTGALFTLSPWEARILSRLLFKRDDVVASRTMAFCQRRWAPHAMLAVHAVFETAFWARARGEGPEWLNELIRL